MNNSELDKILRNAKTPPVSEESAETFSRSVIANLKREPRVPRAQLSWAARFGWVAAAAACVLAVVGIGVMERNSRPVYPTVARTTTTNSTEDILASGKVIGQVLSMFPNRVRAIIEDSEGMHIVLSDQESTRSSAPLFVHLCDAKSCCSFVTFSGQEVNVGGREVTTLCDARGGIILSGDQFVWSSTGGLESGQPMKIEAKSISGQAM